MKAVLRTFYREDPNNQLVEDVTDLEWTVAETPEQMATGLEGAQVLAVTNRACLPEYGPPLLKHGGSLGWIHFLTAGVDKAIEMGLPEWPIVSNSTGVKAGVVAEHAVTLLLAMARRLKDFDRLQSERKWIRDPMVPLVGSLCEMTVCVIGLGAIGHSIVRKLVAFDARVIAVSRAGAAEGVSRVFPREELAAALGQADAVILSTSSDETTRHLIDAKALAAMRPSAFLVNIARGALVDEGALISALEADRLGGAAIDVQETEPMPADDPLWTTKNLIITPHLAGAGSTGYPAAKALFLENLERYRQGRELINQIDPPRVKG
jgi:phosphoglycerate dehydrogenase-like enzyme